MRCSICIHPPIMCRLFELFFSRRRVLKDLSGYSNFSDRSERRDYPAFPPHMANNLEYPSRCSSDYYYLFIAQSTLQQAASRLITVARRGGSMMRSCCTTLVAFLAISLVLVSQSLAEKMKHQPTRVRRALSSSSGTYVRSNIFFNYYIYIYYVRMYLL